MEKIETLFEIQLPWFTIPITESVLTQWVILVLVLIASLLLTRNLSKHPSKRQSAVEIFVTTVNKFVKDNMGEHCIGFVPYIGSLIVFLVLVNLTPLVGVKAPTEDLNVCLGIAAISFFVIQAYAIKKAGILHYFLGYGKPMFFLLPINLMERIMLPISLSLRLFGNLTAGAVIMSLIYKTLGGITPAFPILQLIIPIPLHFYFDVFDGIIQMVIFVMLTMINIKIIAEH